LRPALRNQKFGVQRMEMLAVYFALADNLADIKRTARRKKSKRVVINIRSDSKSTVEQLLGLCAIRDSVMRRISYVIGKLLARIKCTITFDHLERSHNIAGLLIEQKRRKEREAQLMMPRREIPVVAIQPALLCA